MYFHDNFLEIFIIYLYFNNNFIEILIIYMYFNFLIIIY